MGQVYSPHINRNKVFIHVQYIPPQKTVNYEEAQAQEGSHVPWPRVLILSI